GANEERTLYADFLGDAGMMMLGRLANAKVVLSAGAMATTDHPLLRGFGGSAEIVVKAGAGGATITELYVEARAQNRNTNERTFVEYTPAGSPIPFPKYIELDAPAQGYKTTQMTNVATFLGDKYVNGPALVGLSVPAGPVGGDPVGITGWRRTMEVI